MSNDIRKLVSYDIPNSVLHDITKLVLNDITKLVSNDIRNLVLNDLTKLVLYDIFSHIVSYNLSKLWVKMFSNNRSELGYLIPENVHVQYFASQPAHMLHPTQKPFH